MNVEYSVDLQHNLSLPSYSSAIKYMHEYKYFDPLTDYGAIAISATKFTCFNSNGGLICVTLIVNRMIPSTKRFPSRSNIRILCAQRQSNFQTHYDGIINKLGHELSNCKLSCDSCNVFGKCDDGKITCLHI